MENPPSLITDRDPDPSTEELESLNTVIPDNVNQAYNMLDVVEPIVDGGIFLQVHETFAPNILVGYARISGRSVGIVAQQPAQIAGVLDINASV